MLASRDKWQPAEMLNIQKDDVLVLFALPSSGNGASLG